ncbi:hypothetical protein MLD38_020312 [Melastoma candidum]|uniref:Uncharacterized protein n=1 Tax=Melastoma candidum TaxID=119954 RepID=A0ACB9QCX0_9MYRT|nr:hypothetical protein MLD38_020312 [Melastoma candidum]
MGTEAMDLDRWCPTDCAIATVHDDVIRARILTRLDGPSLACAACASSRLRSIVASDGASLWTEATRAAWPSTSSPPLTCLIPSFPKGYLSFFSDSHPALLPVTTSQPAVQPADPPSGLISAVDLFYEDRILLSQVVETETHTAWFDSSPFRIDVLGLKESIRTDVGDGRTGTCGDLARGMRLSWILIDREGRRAANVSSHEPVEVQRHWLTGDVRVKFTSTVGVTAEGEGTAQCVVVVTCQEGEGVGVGVRVREVSLQVEDVEGTVMSGRESLGILTGVIRGERGRGKVRAGEERRRFEEFERRKKERKERRRRREGRVDLLFVAVGVLCYVLFWGLLCCSK